MLVRRINKNNSEKNKFGIKIPRNVKEALLFDKESKITKWADAISKKVQNLLKMYVVKFFSPDTMLKKVDE